MKNNKFIIYMLIISLFLLSGCTSINSSLSDLKDKLDDYDSNGYKRDDYDDNDDYNYNDDDYDDNYNYNDDDYDDNYNYNDDYEYNDNRDNNDDDKKEVSVKENPNSFAGLVKSGTIENPINKGEVGAVDTYCFGAESEYVNFYLKLQETISGKKAEDLLEKYNESKMLQLGIAEGTEVYATKILIDTKDYILGKYQEYGNLSTFSNSAEIFGIDGEDLEFDNYVYWYIPAKLYTENNEFVPGDICEAYILYTLPKGYRGEFLIGIQNRTDYDKLCYFKVEI